MKLREKLAMQMLLYKNPQLIMNQLMFKRIFVNMWPVPAHGTTHYHVDEDLYILLDNTLAPDDIQIMEKE